MSFLEILDLWILVWIIDTPLPLNVYDFFVDSNLDPKHAFSGDKQSRKCRTSRSFMCMDHRASSVAYPA
jgi:hypothetical protein